MIKFESHSLREEAYYSGADVEKSIKYFCTNLISGNLNDDYLRLFDSSPWELTPIWNRIAPYFYVNELSISDLSSGLKIIGNSLFRNTSLNYIDIPDSVELIKNFAFSNTQLKEIIIPAGVREVYYGAFRDCWSLTKVEFTGPIELIGSETFAQCPDLTDIYIYNADSLEKIAYDAFNGSNKVTVHYNKNTKSNIDLYLANCGVNYKDDL